MTALCQGSLLVSLFVVCLLVLLNFEIDVFGVDSGVFFALYSVAAFFRRAHRDFVVIRKESLLVRVTSGVIFRAHERFSYTL